MIGIICAMKEEINQIIKLMDDKEICEISSCIYTSGRISNTQCVVALSGIGKVHAAVCTQTMILKYSPDLIINSGVAGSLNEDIKIGDIVIAENVIQHDFDVSCFENRKRGVISGINIDKIPCDCDLNKKIIDSALSIPNVKIHTGTILTGDQFINSSEKISELRRYFDGVACEMEAGSIGHVCYINKIPFAVIRSISDCAGESSHVDFSIFLQNSANVASKLLYNYIISR